MKVEIGFKNGMKLKTKCDTFTVDYDKTTGEVNAYDIKNMRGNGIKYLNMNEIVYIVKKTW